MGLGTLIFADHRAWSSINQSDCGSAWSWHPQISKSLSWDRYQPIRLRICWVSLATSPLQQTQPLILSKLPLRGGLTVFVYDIVAEFTCVNAIMLRRIPFQTVDAQLCSCGKFADIKGTVGSRQLGPIILRLTCKP